MKKKRLLKTLSFSSLAVLMAAAGTFAFAPLGASPSTLANADVSDTINTVAGNGIEYAPSPLGLDPENDPVIYTTASGLEIKYGGLDIEASLSSSNPNLIGYPYFTMGTYNGYAVNWVIIGRAPNTTTFNSAFKTILFSTWKGKTNYNYNKYFLSNVYETTTPAGTAINSATSSKSYVSDNYTLDLREVIENDEIDDGCILAVTECCLGTSAFNTIGYGNRYEYLSDVAISRGTSNYAHTYNKKTPGTLYSRIKQLYDSGLNLSQEHRNIIKPQQIIYHYYTNGHQVSTETLKHNLFPLSYSGGDETFTANTYLPGISGITPIMASSMRITYNIGTTTPIYWWVTTGHTSGAYGHSVAYNTLGGGAGADSDNSYGVRPACVIKLS